MKTILKSGFIALAFTYGHAAAQNITGLFKTESDYVANKLSFQQDCSSKGNTIKTDNTFIPSTITVKEHGKKTSLSKKDIFGYQDCAHKVYRFCKGLNYEILDTAGFYLYKRTYLANSKGYVKVSTYYFSKDGKDTVHELSKQNLAKEFSLNRKFIFELDNSFHSDAELSAYIDYLKCFRVKYLYNETVLK